MTPQEFSELITEIWKWRAGDYVFYGNDPMVLLAIYEDGQTCRLGEILGDDCIYEVTRANESPVQYKLTDIAPNILDEHMLDRVLGLIVEKGYCKQEIYEYDTPQGKCDLIITNLRSPLRLDLSFTAPTLIKAAVLALLHVYGIKEADNG